jgi:phosphatidate phosphatase APP1
MEHLAERDDYCWMLLRLGHPHIENQSDPSPTAAMSTIKSDERVVFFPTVARQSEDGRSWQVPIHGWIFEPEENDILRRTLVRKLHDWLKLEPAEPSTRIFDERMRLFLVDNERRKRIAVRLAGEAHTLDTSHADGHFTDTVQLSADRASRSMEGNLLRYQAVTAPNDPRTFCGVTHCLPPQGTSVVSDIDDTIKVTEVFDRRKVIQNTFFREFLAVDGMAQRYRRWADQGADFHYVSASPWQLYEPLTEFMAAAGFPQGTVHLKRVRLKDSTFFSLFEDPVAYKLASIEPLFQQFPSRGFILVGDSGEKDPEVYGTLARRFPAQVKMIHIRDVTGQPDDGSRYREAFHDLPRDLWELW